MMWIDGSKLWRDDSLLELRFGRWGIWWTLVATIVAFSMFLGLSIGIYLLIDRFATVMDAGELWEQAQRDGIWVLLGNPYSLLGFVSIGVAGVVATWVAGRVHGLPGRAFLALFGGFSSVAFWRSGVFWLVSVLLTIPLHYGFYGEAAVWSFELFRYPVFIATALAVIALQTFAEEAFFRGYLYYAWARVFPYPVLITLVCSALFAGAHWWNADVQRDPLPAMVVLFAFAVFAHWLTVRTGSLAAAWGMHFANNAMLTVFFSLRPGNITDAPIFQYTDTVLSNGGSYALDPLFYISFVLGWALTIWLVAWPKSPFFIAPRKTAE